ncbi:hypothetical protein Scep_027640 [Stephania cephalantha]|uniref:Uncharacterized protein n=1 Tax=Stephania cephalantha TaxID=152367 RepID=A0AAP0HHF1_9MAGN
MYPRLLFSSVERTLKAKIDALRKLGFSESQVSELIVCKPMIFFRSIKCQIVPSVECVRRFVKTEENVVRVIKRSKLMLDNNPRARLEPNISVFRDCKVPESRIAYLLMSQPRILMLKTDVLKRKIEEVKELGFQTESGMFTVAMHAKCSMSESTWNSKVSLLKEWGWSEEQIVYAFKRVPLFMTCSETKMKEGLDYFGKTLNWDASMLSKHPKCLLFSLRTRVMPRVEVFKILMSKNVFETDKELPTILDMSEKRFLEKFAAKYQDELSELLKKQNGQQINLS